MRRAVARGRILPQSLSTDPRYGRLSLKAQVLYPLMWINCDDQGRLSGDPDEIKYAACPSVSEITADEIPALLQQMETRSLIKVYTTSKTKAAQMLDWWEEQRLQWAYPSRYPAPTGWTDRLRYHATPKEIITENWPLPRTPKNDLSPDSKKLPSKLPSALPSKLEESPLTTPSEIKNEKEGGKRRGRGNLPSALGSTTTSPSPRASPSESEIFARLSLCFEQGWGQIKASEPEKVYPRRAGGRETAQLRDLASEIFSAGSCPLEWIDEAFRDAAGRPDKMHISYVAEILREWIGIERVHPP